MNHHHVAILLILSRRELNCQNSKTFALNEPGLWINSENSMHVLCNFEISRSVRKVDQLHCLVGRLFGLARGENNIL